MADIETGALGAGASSVTTSHIDDEAGLYFEPLHQEEISISNGALPNSTRTRRRSSSGLSHRSRAGKEYLVRHTSDRSMIRSRKLVDSETGRSGLTLECSVQNVTSHQEPQDPKERFRKNVLALIGVLKEERHQVLPGQLEPPPKQYRFHTTRKGGRWENITGVHDDDDDLYKRSWSVASIVTRYLNWTFRISFKRLFFHFFLSFWVQTLFWSLIILAVADLRPECLQVGSVSPGEVNKHLWIDAYALSWTTFSTVGYGLVYPQITRQVSMEGLHVCGAIIFSKITRVQSYANVVFSTPIVVKYGSGLELVDDDFEEEEEVPFPIVEFRIINQNRCGGGEILNACVKCVASVDEQQASDAILLALGIRNKNIEHVEGSLVRQEAQTALKSPGVGARAGIDSVNFLKKNVKKSMESSRNISEQPSDLFIGSGNYYEEEKQEQTVKDRKSTGRTYDAQKRKRASRRRRRKNIFQEDMMLPNGKKRLSVIDEGSKLVPRRIFSHLELMTDSHPSFKRVWILRHELNEQSPLLKRKARKMIAANGGKWPEELNNYKQIRRNIHFDEIVCSFTGTSNATGSTVYKQQIYDFSTVNIGYCFANLLHIDRNSGILEVDETLLNDVVEQRGGGGEPFGNLKSNVVAAAVAAFKMAAGSASATGRSKFKIVAEKTTGVAESGIEKVETTAAHIKDQIVHVGERAVDKMKPLVGIQEEEHEMAFGDEPEIVEAGTQQSKKTE